MATASKKSSATSEIKNNPLEIEIDKNIIALDLCNDISHGIKYLPMWKTMDRSKTTYFILPQESKRFNYILPGMHRNRIKADPTDFERFWFKLSDSHKERRLLANYMVTCEEIQKAVNEEHETSDQIKSAMVKLIDGVAQMLRSHSLEKNKTAFRERSLMCFIVPDVPGDGRNIFLEMLDRFLATNPPGIKPNCQITDAINDVCVHLAYTLIGFTFGGAINTFFLWISLSIAQSKPYIPRGIKLPRVVDDEKSGRQCQEEFMRKLSLAAPRWSKSDRQFMLRAIETNGQSCRGTYVQFVLKKVGVERFKHLVFGKHRFCAHCNRSSFIGDDRLLACKRCDVEGVRPRAWYCGKECQRADWIKHRAAKHTPVEKTSKKEQKKRKLRK